jgi:hypothetical protein
VAFFFLFFFHGTSIGNGQQGISYNDFRLDAGRELEVQKLSISRMLNRITKVEYSTNALLAFKPMLGDVAFLGVKFLTNGLSDLKKLI